MYIIVYIILNFIGFVETFGVTILLCDYASWREISIF